MNYWVRPNAIYRIVHLSLLLRLLSKNDISIDKFRIVYLSSENQYFYSPNDMNHLLTFSGVWCRLDQISWTWLIFSIALQCADFRSVLSTVRHKIHRKSPSKLTMALTAKNYAIKLMGVQRNRGEVCLIEGLFREILVIKNIFLKL